MNSVVAIAASSRQFRFDPASPDEYKHSPRLDHMKKEETPLNVCLTGAAGQIAYAVLPYLLNGTIFGSRPVALRLLDLSSTLGVLRGVVMELEDCGFAQMKEVLVTDDALEAFQDCDYALLVGAMPRREGMERKDLLQANAHIFKVQGEALNQVARPSVKVLVVGNPANTNALIAARHAPRIPPHNFSALTRLDQSRAAAMLARHLHLPPPDIKNVIIWGNHSNTQYPDISQISLRGQPVDGRTLLPDRRWYEDVFIRAIQTRGAAVIAARKLSSAMSAAKAMADHLVAWVRGTPPGEHISMAVCAPGDLYGVPEGLFFSFPVTCADGTWAIVRDLPLDDSSHHRLQLTTAELCAERDDAISFLSSAPA